MMLEVQMLVMVFSSGLYCWDLVGRGAVEATCMAVRAGDGIGGGGDGAVSMTSIGA